LKIFIDFKLSKIKPRNRNKLAKNQVEMWRGLMSLGIKKYVMLLNIN
jgi:hypothetical protein